MTGFSPSKRLFVLGVLILGASLEACSRSAASDGTSGTNPPANESGNASNSGRPSFFGLSSWAYQLQGYQNRLSEVASSGFGLVVVDASSDGSGDNEWSKTEVAAAKRDKYLISYLSIGEAENYRRYWQSNWKQGTPAFLKAENPNWPGNYIVEYWDAAWQGIILESLDRIIAQGFDGAYLDIVDGYQNFANDAAAKGRMIEWVCRIATHARSKNPNFKIIAQNAAELIREPGYAACVDASGNEETWFTTDDSGSDQATSNSERQSRLAIYADWKKLGKPVFTVDYAAQPGNVKSVYSSAKTAGVIPYVTVKELDRLSVNAGLDPQRKK